MKYLQYFQDFHTNKLTEAVRITSGSMKSVYNPEKKHAVELLKYWSQNFDFESAPEDITDYLWPAFQAYFDVYAKTYKFIEGTSNSLVVVIEANYIELGHGFAIYDTWTRGKQFVMAMGYNGNDAYLTIDGVISSNEWPVRLQNYAKPLFNLRTCVSIIPHWHEIYKLARKSPAQTPENGKGMPAPSGSKTYPLESKMKAYAEKNNKILFTNTLNPMAQFQKEGFDKKDKEEQQQAQTQQNLEKQQAETLTNSTNLNDFLTALRSIPVSSYASIYTNKAYKVQEKYKTFYHDLMGTSARTFNKEKSKIFALLSGMFLDWTTTDIGDTDDIDFHLDYSEAFARAQAAYWMACKEVEKITEFSGNYLLLDEFGHVTKNKKQLRKIYLFGVKTAGNSLATDMEISVSKTEKLEGFQRVDAPIECYVSYFTEPLYNPESVAEFIGGRVQLKSVSNVISKITRFETRYYTSTGVGAQQYKIDKKIKYKRGMATFDEDVSMKEPNYMHYEFDESPYVCTYNYLKQWFEMTI